MTIADMTSAATAPLSDAAFNRSVLARAVCLSNLVCLPISSDWFRREIEDRRRLIKVQCCSGESTANFSIVGLAKLLEQVYMLLIVFSFSVRWMPSV
ncbi:Primary amine oxidase [Apostasia shenzhenica]|uniref:Primary amine oxidase n=1 Tax=Apostasia shenzhenica TaxID=1088818 RepID=A0A2I0A4P9_9ASPA|nr:Primary amine oxidase [Apostasia shenzhenica]